MQQFYDLSVENELESESHPLWWDEKKITLDMVKARSAFLHSRTKQQLDENGTDYHINFYANSSPITDFMDEYTRGRYGVYSTNNIIKMCVDTLKSKIGKQTPRVTYITSDDDFFTQKKTDRIDHFINKQFSMNKMYRNGLQAFFRSMLEDLGCVYIYKKGDNFYCESISVRRIGLGRVNDTSPLDKQDEIYFYRYMTRSEIMKMYPKAKKLDKLESYLIQVNCLIKTNGKKIVFTENEILKKEDYVHDFIPFQFIRWSEDPNSFLGISLSRDLTGLQKRLNRMNKNIIDSMDLASVFRVAVENGSDIAPGKITNQVGSIIRYKNTPPTELKFDGLSGQYFAERNALIDLMFLQAGLSKLSIASEKPPGVRATSSLTALQDIETERFYDVSKRYQDFFLEIGETCLKILLKDPIKKFKIKEEEIKKIDIKPTNLLSNNPAAAINEALQLYQGQILDKDQVLQVLQFQDTDSQIDLASATYNAIRSKIEKMIKEQKPDLPDQDLDMKKQAMVSRNYLAKLIAADDIKNKEQSIELVRNFYEKAVLQMKEKTPPPAPPIEALPQLQGLPPEGQ